MKIVPEKSDVSTDPNIRFLYDNEYNTVYNELKNLILASNTGIVAIDDVMNGTQVRDAILALIAYSISNFSTLYGVGSSNMTAYGDLNAIKPTGIYSVASSTSNAPVATAGNVINARLSSTTGVQVYTTYSTSSSTQGETYFRSVTGNSSGIITSSGSWRKIQFSEDVLATLRTFGLGATTLSSSIADCDTITSSRLFKANNSTTNTPVSGNFYAGVQFNGTSSDEWTQLAIDLVNQEEIYVRRKSAGTIGAWVKMATQNWVNANSRYPRGYLDCPVPSFSPSTPKIVTFSGAITGRSRDNTTNIELSNATRLLDLSTSGANGLADGLTVAPNSWYYLYAYSGGLIASTGTNQNTITIGGISQKVVQLPLALRTNASSDIINFTVSEWNSRSAKIKYHKAWKRAFQGGFEPSWNQTIQTGQTDNRVGTNVNVFDSVITNFTTFDLSSLVPVGATEADIYVYRRSGSTAGDFWLAFRGVTSQTGIDFQKYTRADIGVAVEDIMTLPIDSNREFQMSTTSSNLFVDVSVTGYQIQV